MADNASAPYAYAECADSRRQGTICDRNKFAMHVLVFEPLLGAAEGDGIVAGVDYTVGYRDVAACIDVDSVGVEHPNGILHLNAADLHKFASENEATPAGGVDYGYICYPDVSAFNEANELSGALFFLVTQDAYAVTPTEISLIGEVSLGYKGVAVSVDLAKTGNGAVVDLMRDYKVFSDPLLTRRTVL